jgi:hypothetical protein
MKNLLAKLALLAFTGALCLGTAEFVARRIIDPVNFLRPSLVRDPVLRWRVEPNSAGHDAWGYRNPRVPDSAEIVTVGDSQTYGHGAPASGSWPSWLARITGRDVYNLALGGYGPVDYRALVETRAPALSPKVIVVGLYFGNDLMDAWRSAYTMNHWAFLRDPNWDAGESVPAAPGSFDQVAGGGSAGRSPIHRLKLLLGEHSVLYRMAGLAFSDLIYGFLVERSAGGDPDMVGVRDAGGDFITGLAPARRLRELDLDDPRIREGLRITLDSLDVIRRTCDEQGIDLVVLLIPTKISVFADYRTEARPADLQAVVRQLEDNERAARAEIEAWLDANGVVHVSALETLRGLIDEDRIYPRSEDGHPTSEGYRVLAELVSDRIGSAGTVASGRTDANPANP